MTDADIVRKALDHLRLIAADSASTQVEALEAKAALDRLEAVIEAARRINTPSGKCSCRYMGDGDVVECSACMARHHHKRLRAALAALEQP